MSSANTECFIKKYSETLGSTFLGQKLKAP